MYIKFIYDPVLDCIICYIFEGEELVNAFPLEDAETSENNETHH